MADTKVWHYTTGQFFADIVEDGVIRPATAFVPLGERPIVWFSTNQSWEQTANKVWRHRDGAIIHLNMMQTAELGGGLVRIGVAPETAPHDWRSLRSLSGMSSRMARGMYDSAHAEGANPNDWRGSFEAVPREKWTAVEVWNHGVWVPFPLSRGLRNSTDS